MAIKCSKCQHENPSDTVFCGKCAAPLKPDEKLNVSHTMTLETPSGELTRGVTFANRYEIIEALGEGGMGKVLRAYDTKIKEEMALKLLKPEIAANKKILERFSNEIRLARKVTHKNVCRMHDLHEEDGTSFITMEYVPGEDLKRLIYRTERLTTGKALSIAKQVCEGLIEAHSLGVIHRDLKPRNIMIDTNGNAKIMDFGIARSLHDQGMTADGMIVGTPDYISPEQVEGIPVDQRADIYSLGVILFEMLTGGLPFEGLTPISIAIKHKNEPPPIPQKLNPQISDDLNQLILRCLEKAPEDRYQSAEELHADLSKIEEGIPTLERVKPRRKTLTSKEFTFSFNLKRLLVPSAIFILLIALVIILSRFLPKPASSPIPSEKPTLAVNYFLNNSGDERLDSLRTTCPQWLITDLSQSKYLRVLSMGQVYDVSRRLNLLESHEYSSEDLKNIAIQGNIDHVLQANISKLGDSLRVDYSLYKLDDKNGFNVIASGYVSSSTGEVSPELVDEMTKKIKSHLNLSSSQIEADIDMDIADVTTKNPEALKYFTEGANFRDAHQWDKGIEALEKAVKFDPEFAMAYALMGTMYWNKLDQSSAAGFFKKALEFRGRLPLKNRLILEGQLYSLYEQTKTDAIDKFKEALNIYPDDFDANHYLSAIYSGTGEIELAIPLQERINKIYPKNQYPYNKLLALYGSTGQYDKIRKLAQQLSLNVSLPPQVLHWRVGEIYTVERKYGPALEEFEKALTLKPDYSAAQMAMGFLYQLQSEFDKTHEIFQARLDAQEIPSRKSLWNMTYLYISKGMIQKATEIAESIYEIHKDKMVGWDAPNHFSAMGVRYFAFGKHETAFDYFQKTIDLIEVLQKESSDKNIWVYPYNKRMFLRWQAAAYLEMDKLPEAEKIMEKIEELMPKTIQYSEIWHWPLLQGKVSLLKGDYDQAIQSLEKVWAQFPYENTYNWAGQHAFLLNELASAYKASDKVNKALDTYEKITLLTAGRLKWGNIYAKSYYNMGLLHEQKRNKGKAIENYEKFLEIWKDADPGIPEVDDARIRLKNAYQ